jgi:hypothetical protein
MAWTKSGLYVHTLVDLFTAVSLTGGQLNLTLATYKIALHNSTNTDGSSPINFSTATSGWVNTNEVSGTGWAAGGVLLSAAASGGGSVTPTFAEGTAGSLRYNWTSALSVASTTLNTSGGPFGCIIYADPVSSPADMAKAMILAICFGAAYPTNNGTFGITPSGTGLCEIDITP